MFIQFVLYYSGKIKKTGLSAILQYKLEHNPVVHDYYVQDTYLVRSFINRGNIHYYAAILALRTRSTGCSACRAI